MAYCCGAVARNQTFKSVGRRHRAVSVAIVGLANTTIADGWRQGCRCNTGRDVLACGTEHVIGGGGTVAACNASDRQTRYRHGVGSYHVGIVVGCASAAQRNGTVTRDQTCNGVAWRKACWRGSGAVIGLDDTGIGQRGRQRRGINRASYACDGGLRCKYVVAGGGDHQVARTAAVMGAAAAAAQCAQRHVARGTDGLASRGHMGIAEGQRHAAGVQRHSVSSHSTAGVAADGGARGCLQTIVGLGGGGNAGAGAQWPGSDARCDIRACSVEHVVGGIRAVVARDAGDRQPRDRHCGGTNHVGVVVGCRAVAQRGGTVTRDQTAEAVAWGETVRRSAGTVIDLADTAVGHRRCQRGRVDGNGIANAGRRQIGQYVVADQSTRAIAGIGQRDGVDILAAGGNVGIAGAGAGTTVVKCLGHTVHRDARADGDFARQAGVAVVSLAGAQADGLGGDVRGGAGRGVGQVVVARRCAAQCQTADIDHRAGANILVDKSAGGRCHAQVVTADHAGEARIAAVEHCAGAAVIGLVRRRDIGHRRDVGLGDDADVAADGCRQGVVDQWRAAAGCVVAIGQAHRDEFTGTRGSRVVSTCGFGNAGAFARDKAAQDKVA